MRWFLLLLLVTVNPLAAADNWPQFRGPGGDGIAEGDPPVTWSENENVRWKVAIHDKGWSSPVIWGDQIWMTTATEDGTRMYAVCVDRESGEIVHDVLVFETDKPQYCHPTNSYASGTPVVADGRLYVHYGTYGTACLDTKSGVKLWERRDLRCNHWRGPGSSPVVHNGRLIFSLDGYDYQYVVALDTKTGRTVWRQDRDIDYGTDNGDRKKAYSTPAVFELDGQTQVVSPSAMETISYDPDNGEELWRVRHGGMNAACRPLFANGLVYICAGDGPNALIAVRPDGAGDVTDTHVAWAFGKSTPKRPSQLVLGERIFMMNDEGVASCVNAITGKIVWQKRAGGEYRSSPVAANGRVYFFDLTGRCVVIAATDKYQELANNELESGCQASPAVVGDALYIRTISHLYRIEQ